MKIKRLTECWVEADVSGGLWWSDRKTPETEAKAMESLVSEFNSFIRDHRSMDWVNLQVIKKFSDVCSHCGYNWEEDEEGCPMCCNKAQEEFEQNKLELLSK